MKKYLKVLLMVLVLIIVFVAYFGYQVYHMVAGNEDLSGKVESIPNQIDNGSIYTKGLADWPNWRGANFDGKSKTTGIKTDWSNGLSKLWQVDFLCQGNGTATWSTPVVQGNRLIIPGRDVNNDLVFCINTDSGDLIWMGSYPAAAGTSHGLGSRATPFIDSNYVYTFGRSGDLACWKFDDGKLVWRKNVKDIGGAEPSWGFSTTPLVIDNKVIVQGGGKALVIAYDKINGDVIWTSLEGDVGYCATIPFSIEGVKRLLVYHAKALSCLNPIDGQELWRIPWETEYGVNATTPALEGTTLFFTSGYEMGCAVIKLERDSYKMYWKNKAISAMHSDPIIIDGYVYGYSGESSRNIGQFKCLELASGKEMWSTDEIGQGTTTFVDGHLINLDLKGNLFLIKPEPSKFNKVGEIKGAVPNVKSLSWTVPVVANGKLYLRYMQTLICYDLVN